jgi:hypothetical protein
MITLGFLFAIPVGAVLTSTLVQGSLLPQISVFETMPWPEIGLTFGVFVRRVAHPQSRPPDHFPDG